MGQDQSVQSITSKLNCKIGQKDPKDTQYETTRPNAHLDFYRPIQVEQKKPIYSIFQSYQNQDPNSNQSNTSQGSLSLQHQNIVKQQDSPFENSEYIKQIRIYREKNLISLTQIIQNRISQGNMGSSVSAFTKEEAKGLLESLVYGLAYLSHQQQQNPRIPVNHHNFYPSVIFKSRQSQKDNQTCIFKIANPSGNVPSSYFLTSTRKRFSFLSPQLILAIVDQKCQEEILQEDRKSNNKVMQKSDVFAIGMILLEFCSLKPSAQCYDQENYNILDVTIKERLDDISNIYCQNQPYGKSFGEVLCELISIMLEYQVQKRIDAQSLALLVWQKMNTNGNVMIKRHGPQQRTVMSHMPLSQNFRGAPARNLNVPIHPQPIIINQPVPSNMQQYPHQNLQQQPQHHAYQQNFIGQQRNQIPKFKIIQKMAMTPNGPVLISQEMVPNTSNQNESFMPSNLPNNGFQFQSQRIPQNSSNQRFNAPYTHINLPNHNVNIKQELISQKNNGQIKHAPNPFQQIPQSQAHQNIKKSIQSKYALSDQLNQRYQNRQKLQQTSLKIRNQDREVKKGSQTEHLLNKYTHYTGNNFTLGQIPTSLTSLGGYQKFSSNSKLQTQHSHLNKNANRNANTNYYQHHYSLQEDSRKETLEQRVQRILNISRNIK